MPLKRILAGPVEDAARGLLGCELVREDVVLRIVEVEAYAGPEDTASHARHGRTARNAPMWGAPGRAYLYFCYGMHWMLNVVTGPEGVASAVLIRGAEVLAGMDTVLARRRAAKPSAQICAGPGKVAQALGLARESDGLDLLRAEGLHLRPGLTPGAILSGPRVGIGFAVEPDRLRSWRFALAGSPAVSRPRIAP
ncbi:MAG: DNA-3-methyladenine glycosylase [Acidobacteria bacterium]|nr:DNA-3-methyladenine glycosylase [Acidobacteriota bacterium]